MQVVDNRCSITLKFGDAIRKQNFRYNDTIYTKIDDGNAFRFDTADVEKFTEDTVIEVVSIRLVITS